MLLSASWSWFAQGFCMNFPSLQQVGAKGTSVVIAQQEMNASPVRIYEYISCYCCFLREAAECARVEALSGWIFVLFACLLSEIRSKKLHWCVVASRNNCDSKWQLHCVQCSCNNLLWFLFICILLQHGGDCECRIFTNDVVSINS